MSLWQKKGFFRLSDCIRKDCHVTQEIDADQLNELDIYDAYNYRHAERLDRIKVKKVYWPDIRGKISNFSKDPYKEEILDSFVHCMQKLIGRDSEDEFLEAQLLFAIEKRLVYPKWKRILISMHLERASEKMINDLINQVDKICSWIPQKEKYLLLSLKDGTSEPLKEPFLYNLDNINPKTRHKEKSLYTSNHNNKPPGFCEAVQNLTLNSEANHSSHNSAAQLFNKSWLKKQVEISDTETFIACLGLTVDEMVDAILNKVLNSRNSDELQNDLFNFLGFERISLIEKVIQNYGGILTDNTPSLPPPAPAIVNNEKPTKGDILIKNFKEFDHTSRPAPQVQKWVTVQTDKEKEIEKQIKKDRKRANRHQQNNEETTTKKDFDIEYMKEQRIRELVRIRTEPLFPQPSRHEITTEKYPNVYDSLLEAKQSASFYHKHKIYLNLEEKRINNQYFEQVTVPAKKKNTLPAEVRQRYPVDMLDKVGKMGFMNIKDLNIIQSLVLQVAYNSNENMLVCAPTGAGKTNIAMLTVLHTIMENMDGDRILADNFKIIYIAPMKALAAEMVRNFQNRLNPFNLKVKELTGDMQMTKQEILNTQMIITTPEKWDVVTRKATGDIALSQLVQLLIIDEVHLLHGDRGPVLETIVARTLRQIETSQKMIRIIGLSATLPNYTDVAQFLRVNLYKGMFYFDDRFRPVPLCQTFIGVKSLSMTGQQNEMNNVCYEKIVEMLRQDHQVMIFVHARNQTTKTAQMMSIMAEERGEQELFTPESGPKLNQAEKEIEKSQNRILKELFKKGFGIHHAGMLRHDRNRVERLFTDKMIKVLCCTATLAWGVNLPAHAVIIKGTEIYDAKSSCYTDIGILDVLQIFGRAGRPQFDKEGDAFIITRHDRLQHYLNLLTNQIPIESQFQNNLVDNLNAEICLGTVANVEEAIEWLSYTYFFVRIKKNPIVYGINHSILEQDPQLFEFRRDIIDKAAKTLDKIHMIRYDSVNGYFHPIDLGRIASNYYIKSDTVDLFHSEINSELSDGQIIDLVANAEEFHQIKSRDEEDDELFFLRENCQVDVAQDFSDSKGKVNILIQSYISRANISTFSLVSDQNYIIQNVTRLMRALFEMYLKNNKAVMTMRMLNMCLMAERQVWGCFNPLLQFTEVCNDHTLLKKLKIQRLSLDNLRDMNSKDIGHSVNNVKKGSVLKHCVMALPKVDLQHIVQPITREVLRVSVTITPMFRWYKKETQEPFWLWIQDTDDNYIHHSEYFVLTKKQVDAKEPLQLCFTIPIQEPLPTQYIIHISSDRWLGCIDSFPVSFKHLILPELHPPHTDLLNLAPLSKKALHNEDYESLYPFTHFNPIQTQVFHTLYNTDHNALIGAPTGSGKTITAEFAMFRCFNCYPTSKVVYIAPLKALVRERMNDWKPRFGRLNKKVIELTGDVAPDPSLIRRADIIVTTPEKWDGVSRSWQTRNFVRSVALMIIDEIHLLGQERGPILEVIVSRTNFISAATDLHIRIVGLSTAIANAQDLASWLNIKKTGVYNFRPSVRPVPLEIHISGYPGKHYCPRMALMNKPAFQAIKTHSPEKPTLVFVSSRRQTRLTANDLIAHLGGEDFPHQWCKMEGSELEYCIAKANDTNLKLTLAFGIGVHHAGLSPNDRELCEKLFAAQKIQVLIATSTLAWGVNLPAHLVVIKGTEYFDAKSHRYLDAPVTDVLQMMGRAGRPQFDDEGVAVILVHDIKKQFYTKFLHNPFPVESKLLEVLDNHLNAEIASGTLSSVQECLDYTTWTYFFRRLLKNPFYYGLQNTDIQDINQFLSRIIERTLDNLSRSNCIVFNEEDGNKFEPTALGKIASYYYISHETVRMFSRELNLKSTVRLLLVILSGAEEYKTFPLRHNEELLNLELAPKCRYQDMTNGYDSPHTKVYLLLLSFLSSVSLPSVDYYTDLKSVLDQAIRIVQAMIDVTGDKGLMATVLRCISILQMLSQALWNDDSPLLMLPHVKQEHLKHFRASMRGSTSELIETIPELTSFLLYREDVLHRMLSSVFQEKQIRAIFTALHQLPLIDVDICISGEWEENPDLKKVKIKKDAFHTRNAHRQVLHADQEYSIEVRLTRRNKAQASNKYLVVSRFPKKKMEGWFLLLGEIDMGELHCMRRVPYIARSSTFKLSFVTPADLGPRIFTLYLISDGYMSLDQQYSFNVEIIEPCLSNNLYSEFMLLNEYNDDQREEEEQFYSEEENKGEGKKEIQPFRLSKI